MLRSQVDHLMEVMVGSGGFSRDFFDLIRHVGEARGRQEEHRIIKAEIATLKALRSSPNQPKKPKEILVRMIYCEMLGHDASFGYIQAVNMTQQPQLINKRVGYLACSLFLNPDHELMVLLVNSFLRDLASMNYMEVCCALNAMSRLLNKEIIPAVLPMVENLLRHQQELVRKKAVMVVHRCWLLDPESVLDISDKAKTTLCDVNPCVMAASLCLFSDLIKAKPRTFKEAVGSFVSILKQVSERALPASYEYHRLPSPWIQIRLLKILALLGENDQRVSEHMYEVVKQTMISADNGMNAGYSVVYECVCTITRIYPNDALLDAAANCISRFITSNNHNLKYLGLHGLSMIVQINPKYAIEHQMSVVECLEDPDETLRRKTLELLYRMTNPGNVEVITEKMLDHLRLAKKEDIHFRTELVDRITSSAEKFAPSNGWYIHTVLQVLLLGGELVDESVAHNMLALIGEGNGEGNEAADNRLRVFAVHVCLKKIRRPHLPDVLVKVISWVLGEYGGLTDRYSKAELLDYLYDLLDRSFADDDTRVWIFSGIAKLVAQLGSFPKHIRAAVQKYRVSRSFETQQICYELETLATNMRLMQHVLPVDASCEDLEVNLSFLDPLVSEALQNGAADYNPPVDDIFALELQETTARGKESSSALKFDAYAAPVKPGNEPVHLPEQSAAELTLNDAAAAMGVSAMSPYASTPSASGVRSEAASLAIAIGYAGNQRWTLDALESAPVSSAAATGAGVPAAGSPASAASSALGTTPGQRWDVPTAARSAAASSSPSSTPTPTAANATHVVSEKEQLASALFGSKPRAPRRRRRREDQASSPVSTPVTSVATPPARSVPPSSMVATQANHPSSVVTSANTNAATSPFVASAQPQVDLLLDFVVPSSSPSAAVPPSTAVTSSPLSPTAVTAAVPTAQMDLLSLSSPPPATATMSPSPIADLLTPSTLSPAVTTATSPPPSSPSPSSSGLGAGADLLSSLSPTVLSSASSSSSSTLPSSTAPPHAQHASLMPTTRVVTSAGSADTALAGLSAHARTQIEQWPRSAVSPQQFGQGAESCLLVSSLKVFRDEELCVALLLQNKTAAALLNVSVSFVAPASTTVSACHGEPGSAAATPSTVQLRAIQPQTTSTAFVHLRFARVAPQMHLTGRCVYSTVSGSTDAVSFSVPLVISDFLRALPLPTATFGQQWKQFSCERSLVITPCPAKTPAEYLDLLSQRMHVAKGQIIRQEAIASATLINLNKTVLFHGTLKGVALHLLIRSNDKPLCEACALLCDKALS